MTLDIAQHTRFARPGDKANVLMPDGEERRATATNYPDTFFSTPARVSWQGRTVSGWVAPGDDGYFHFHPN